MMYSCKEASQKVSYALDRKLSYMERMHLRLHLFLCKKCQNFKQNLQLIQKILQQQKSKENLHLSKEERQIIQTNLKESYPDANVHEHTKHESSDKN